MLVLACPGAGASAGLGVFDNELGRHVEWGVFAHLACMGGESERSGLPYQFIVLGEPATEIRPRCTFCGEDEPPASVLEEWAEW